MRSIERNPTLGWYPDVPAEELAGKAWHEAWNVRYKHNAVERIRNSGQFGSQQFTWYRVVNPAPAASVSTPDPVTGFAQLLEATGVEHTLALTQHEIYELDSLGVWDTDEDDRLTPYFPDIAVSTAGCPGGSPTVTGAAGASWLGGGADTDNLPQPGDWIKFTGFAGWYQIRSVDLDTQITLVGNGPNTGGQVAYTIRLLNGSTRTFPADSLTRGDRRAWITREWHDPVATDISTWLLATNGYNTPIKWSGTGQFEFIGGLRTLEGGVGAPDDLDMRFSAMAVFYNTLFVGDTQEDNGTGGLSRFPSRLRWCNLNNFESWNVVLLGDQAGFTPVGEGSDPIMVLETLGDNLVIYKERHIYRAQYVGYSNGTVRVPVVTDRHGACSRRAVASNGQVHCFCDSENIYLLLPDMTIVPIGNPIRQYWKERFNRILADNIEIQWRPDTNEFWIVTTNEPGTAPTATEALILQLPDGTYTAATDNSLSLPVWSHVELPDCSALGQLTAKSYIHCSDALDICSTVLTPCNEMYHEVYGFYIWGDINGRTWYMEYDAGDGLVLARTGIIQTKLEGNPFAPALVRAGQFVTDNRNESIGWWIGFADRPDDDFITWYGRDGLVNGALYRYLRNGRCEGIKRADLYRALRGFLTADDDNRVRTFGYQFDVVPMAVRR